MTFTEAETLVIAIVTVVNAVAVIGVLSGLAIWDWGVERRAGRRRQ